MSHDAAQQLHWGHLTCICTCVCACDVSDMNVFDDLCSTFVWCTTSILHYEAHNTVSTVLDIGVFV